MYEGEVKKWKLANWQHDVVWYPITEAVMILRDNIMLSNNILFLFNMLLPFAMLINR
jgi:hypothetical protein